MEDTLEAIINSGGNDAWFDTMPGELMRVRISRRDTNGSMSVVEAIVPAGSGPPTHFHKDREELFHILEGHFRFRCGDKEFIVEAGALVAVPRGVPHAWINAGSADARIMFIFSPAGIEDFFPRISKTPPERWPEVAHNFDTFIVGPPLASA